MFCSQNREFSQYKNTLVPSTWDVVPEDAAEGITKDTKFDSEVVDKGAAVQLKGTKIRINRGLVNEEYTSAASTPNANTGDNSFNASDIFNDADEYEQYLVNKEKARLFFPKGAKELESAYSRRLEKHSINEAKRQGLGNFYKYEFNAPKHLKHLELTAPEQAALLMDDAVDAAKACDVLNLARYKFDFTSGDVLPNSNPRDTKLTISSQKTEVDRVEVSVDMVNADGVDSTVEFTGPFSGFVSGLVSVFLKDDSPVMFYSPNRLLIKAPYLSR